MPHDNTHKVIIIGGGFGGLYAAKNLKRAPVEVTLIDRRNFHLFQPLLYQVATGILCPGEIASPLRHILRRQKNTKVLLGEVVDIDPAKKTVILADGAVAYDTLIIATGMENYYYGNESWAKFAPGLKTIEDGARIRQKIFFAFEVAEREENPAARKAWLTFVIVGSGPTGVELSGMVSEIARKTLREDFRAIRPEESNIILVDLAERILPSYPPGLSKKAADSLTRLGVMIRNGVRVASIDEGGVTVEGPSGRERLDAKTVLWAAGVKASPLGGKLAERTGVRLDSIGRVVVNPDLSVPGHPDIFVIGDCAGVPGSDGKPLPGVAPVATQQGRFVARTIRARLGDKKTPQAFRYFDKGTLAVIGRNAAVADIGKLHFSGVPAWILWLFVHLMLLVEFENRVVVFIRWAFQYFTFNRGSRQLRAEGPVRLPLTTSSVKDDTINNRD
ncbi:MAG: NAD(P)/FAD-dependent oxidoreductase [Deltaproteobacteria bacterium]|nr:NAD(P)/FAD-dependent oxidoreductase [Deltaproteobacteria bacterium]